MGLLNSKLLFFDNDPALSSNMSGERKGATRVVYDKLYYDYLLKREKSRG